MEAWTVKSDATRDAFIEHVRKLYNEHGYVTFEWDFAKKRTLKQNNALHLWLHDVAELLNEAGMDMRKTLKPEYEIPWTRDSAKEHIWKPIQKLMLDKDSTSECDTSQYNKVYQVLCRHFSEKHGITLPEWPHDKNTD